MLNKLKKLSLKQILLIVLFLSFFLLLRWNHFSAPFERDEGEYAYSAWIMRKGIMPYENSFPYKPPMIIYTYYLSQVVFGDNVYSPRIVAATFSLLTVLLIALIAKREYGTTSGWISAFLLSIMLILPVNFGHGMLADVYYAANTEIFMVLPLVALLYLYISFRGKAGGKIWFLAGVLVSLAVNYKPICLLIIAAVFIFWLIDTWNHRKDFVSISLKFLLAFTGIILTSFFIYLPFLLSDGGRAVWDGLVNFTSCYSAGSQWNFGFNNLINRFIIMSRYYWSLYLIFIYFLYRKPKDWLLFTSLFFISFLSIYQSLMGHYFIQIMPFLAIISAAAVGGLLKEKMVVKYSWLLVLAVMFSIIWPIREMFIKSPKQLGLWVYGNLDPYYEAEIVGKRMKELTRPDDYVFSEGEDPEITYHAQRRSSLRIESTGFFTYDCPMIEQYKKQALKDLKDRPPAAIVTCTTGSCSFLWGDKNAKQYMDLIKKMIDDDYIAVGGWVPDRGGYWLEPIRSEDIPFARSLLYKRK